MYQLYASIQSLHTSCQYHQSFFEDCLLWNYLYSAAFQDCQVEEDNFFLAFVAHIFCPACSAIQPPPVINFYGTGPAQNPKLKGTGTAEGQERALALSSCILKCLHFSPFFRDGKVLTPVSASFLWAVKLREKQF